MNFEICKKCLSYDESFFVSLYCDIHCPKLKVVYAIFESETAFGLRTHCHIDCDVLVNEGIVKGDYESGLDYRTYQLAIGKEHEFFDLIKYFECCTIKSDSSGLVACPYFLEHQLYDWNLEQ